MEKPINHDVASSAITTAGSTAKGALGGLVTAGLVGAAVFAAVAAVPALIIGGIAAATGYAFSIPIALGVASAAGFVSGVAGLGTVGAAVGSAVGLVKGTSKVRGEKISFNKQIQAQQEHQQNIDATMQQVQQQAYVAGARDGQAQIIQELQKIQAAQEQQTNFAAKFANKKNAITPEAIAKQRETAVASQQQLGA